MCCIHDNLKQVEMNTYITIIKSLFSNADGSNPDRTRSMVVIKSSVISFGTKMVTILLGIVTMPLVYNNLDKYQYGVYVTLTSIISWIDMFDFGIASGMRNRLTEARVEGNIPRARKYVSTSYCLLTLIAVSVFFLYCFFIKHINWQSILNAEAIEANALNNIAFWVLVLFLIRFVASIINNVYYAFQEAYMVDVTQMIGKVVYLVSVLLLVHTDKITLFMVAIFQSGIAAMVPVVAALYFFGIKHRDYFPSFSFIDFKISGDILGLGWQFFIIQISLLVIHSGNNLLISHFVDPASVPAYSLSYQLFSYALLAYTIIITPLWSAYTEAWQMGRIEWIENTISRIKRIYFVFAIGCLLVVAISPWIFKIWIGNKADVPIIMSLAVAVMILLDMWIRIYDYFINGVGKVRIQMILTIFMAILYIPLAYCLTTVLGLGAIGVVLASIISYGISAIISPLQARLILKGTAKGIWNK